MGGHLGGKRFDHIFNTMPDIVEFVFEMWNEESCTGVFLNFYKYVHEKLGEENELENHEQRCIDFVAARKKVIDKLPCYLLKYVTVHDVISS